MRIVGIAGIAILVVLAIIAIVDVATSGTEDTDPGGLGNCVVRRNAVLPDWCEGSPELPCNDPGFCIVTATQCYIAIFGACIVQQPDACSCAFAVQ